MDRLHAISGMLIVLSSTLSAIVYPGCQAILTAFNRIHLAAQP